MRMALALVLLAGCRAVTPAPAPVVAKKKIAPPYNWKRDGNMTQGEGDAKCRAERKDCPRPFAIYVAPPHPCANKGIRCMEMPRGEGYWTCDCDECTSPSECGAGKYCGTNALPCSPERHVLRCIDGPAPKAVPCPPPAVRDLPQ